jgi:hypothetical protein
MKVLNSSGLSSFGGLNFVLAELPSEEVHLQIYLCSSKMDKRLPTTTIAIVREFAFAKLILRMLMVLMNPVPEWGLRTLSHYASLSGR